MSAPPTHVGGIGGVQRRARKGGGRHPNVDPGAECVARAGQAGHHNVRRRARTDGARLVAVPVRVEHHQKGWVSCSTTLYRARHPRPIAPSDHATLESFVAAVEAAWKVTWERAYGLRDAHERKGGGDREMV